jgi:protein TonB
MPDKLGLAKKPTQVWRELHPVGGWGAATGVTAMMMKTAGGPGLVSPLDYGERKKPLPRTTWIVVGVVALAHVGVGAALYYQKFELTQLDTQPEPPSVTITMERPVIPPTPQKPLPEQPPAANNTIHETPTPTQPTVTFDADPSPHTNTDPGPVIAFENPRPVEHPAVVEPARTPPVITSPRWASQPSAAQMSRAFPDRALTDGTSGSASLLCTVSAAGTLSGCSVTSETPSNRRFGNAAMSLTRYFRMQPGAVNGQAIDGAQVSFTVRFTVSD